MSSGATGGLMTTMGVPRGFDRRIVVVQAGAIELVGLSGRGFRFEQGGILWLAGLPLQALRNTDAEPVVLVALRRTRRR